MNADEFKTDLRHVIDANPQPIKFVFKYCNTQTPKEIFYTKKEFGLRLLQLLEDPEIDDVSVYMVKQRGMLRYMANMKSICNWHQFSTTRECARKPVIRKNIEELTFLVTTKTDVEKRNEGFKNMGPEKYKDQK